VRWLNRTRRGGGVVIVCSSYIRVRAWARGIALARAMTRMSGSPLTLSPVKG